MKIEYLQEQEYWDVKLDWASPVKWTGNGKIRLEGKANTDSGFYRVETEYRGSMELTYIGIAYEQTIEKRVNQHPDEFTQWARKGSLWVSYAIPVIDGNHTLTRYKQIEHVLTYFCKPEEPDQNINTVPNGRDCYYGITNTGERGLLPGKIVYPVAEVTK